MLEPENVNEVFNEPTEPTDRTQTMMSFFES